MTTLVKGLTPITFAAMTYSELLICSIWERTRRAMGHQPVTHMANSRVGTLLLSRMTDSRMMTSMFGTLLKISTMRIRILSTQPPK